MTADLLPDILLSLMGKRISHLKAVAVFVLAAVLVLGSAVAGAAVCDCRDHRAELRHLCGQTAARDLEKPSHCNPGKSDKDQTDEEQAPSQSKADCCGLEAGHAFQEEPFQLPHTAASHVSPDRTVQGFIDSHDLQQNFQRIALGKGLFPHPPILLLTQTFLI